MRKRETARARSSVVLFAGLSLYGALFPVLMAGRDVNFDGGYDKYTLHASPAAAILLVAFIFGFSRGRGRQMLLGLLIFLGVSSSVLNAYHWERFWENQRAVWWQLWWRAPGLQDGTVLLVSIPEESFFEDYEMWGPANLIYRPGLQTITLGAEILESIDDRQDTGRHGRGRAACGSSTLRGTSTGACCCPWDRAIRVCTSSTVMTSHFRWNTKPSWCPSCVTRMSNRSTRPAAPAPRRP